MTARFYLHDAATANTGTLPSGDHSSLTSNPSATPPATNLTQRSMDGTISVTAQASLAGTTQATVTAQAMLMGMWESAPLSAQTLPTGTWTLSFASSEANAASNYQTTFCLYVWRPGTGAVVSTLYDHAAAAAEPGTSQTAATLTTGSVTGVAVNAGDVLVLEVWRASVAQGGATARVNTFFYDGTTEASTSSCASFLNCNGGDIAIPQTWGLAGSASNTASAPAAYNVIQSASASNTGSGNVSVTLASNVTAGSKLIVLAGVSCSSTSFIVSGVADGALNAWTLLASKISADFSAHQGLYALDVPGGDAGTKPVITATIGSNFGASILVQEVSGLASGNTTGMLDGPAVTSTGTASPAAGGSYSSSASGEYLVATFSDQGNALTLTTPAGYTADAHNVTGNSLCDTALFYKSTSGGAESASIILSGPASWDTIFAAFQLGTGGSGLQAASGALVIAGTTWSAAGTAPSASAAAGTLTIPGLPTTWAAAGTAAAASGASGMFVSAVPVITGLGGVPGPGYFTDQAGHPRLWVATETWGLPVNAGNYSSTYQADYDTFFANRAAQGFTVCLTDPVWAEAEATAYDGKDWDGTTPLAGGSTDPSTAALNSTFWTRIDYMMTSAAANGITLGIDLYNTNAVSNASSLTHSWTATQWTAWAQKIATRYASTPNLIWLVGNDDVSPFSDTNLNAILTGLSNAGDTHLFISWYNPETTSRYDTSSNASEDVGVAHSVADFCYTYNAGYWVIEYAYLEVANEGASNLLPVIWGDGYFYNNSSGAAYSSTLDRALRQEWWWCLASGARGVLGEAENVYPWTSSSAAAVTGDWFFANNAANIVTAFTGLPGWHQLIPDTSNALVTAGRGTRVTGFTSGGSGGQYEPAFTNSYVAASRTPDSGSGSSLAVLYLPNHTTITIDQTKMVSGYTATWVDPVSGATSSATAGSTYNSTAKGTNSQGDPDWVLVFQALTGATWTLAGTAPSASSASGTVTLHPAVIAGTAAKATAGSGAFTPATAAGTAATASAASGSAGLLIPYAGTAASASSAAGTFTLHPAAVAGTAGSVPAASGGFQPAAVAGTAATVSVTSAGITVTSGANTWTAAGTAASVSAASGTAGLQVPYAGTAAAASAAAAAFTPATAAGTAATATVTAGDVTVTSGAVTWPANGTAATATTASGSAGLLIPYAATAAAATTGAGTFGLFIPYAGTAVTPASASGAFLAAPVAGTAATVSSGTGAVTAGIGPVTWSAAGTARTPSPAAGTLLFAPAVIRGVAVTASGGDGAVAITWLLAGTAADTSTAAGPFGPLALAGAALTFTAAAAAITSAAIYNAASAATVTSPAASAATVTSPAASAATVSDG